MSDDAISFANLPGNKISIASPYDGRAETSARDTAAGGLALLRNITGQRMRALAGALSFCCALGLWSAPALLLSRYTAEQLLDGLITVSVKPTISALLRLSVALFYIVTSGLLLGAATAPRLRQRWMLRTLLRLGVAPLIGLSLGATMLVAMPLFFGLLIKCFPDLL